MLRIYSVIFFILLASECKCQITGDSSSIGKIYSLGEVLVSEENEYYSVTSYEIRQSNAFTAGSAIRNLPSVVLSSSGSRNESTVFIHGFDTRSVPVYIDGIPVYVPYEGYVDLSRFTTFDIARIDVSKGFSPMSFGANTAGGAINIVSTKPAGKFDLEARTGIMSGKGYIASVNAGSNFGKAYYQTGLSITGREYFPVSASFDTIAYERDRKRDNSDSKDIKFSFKTGITPSKEDEYSINYIFAHGSKGNPVYTGSDSNTKIRFWRWPIWDKQSIYYISRTTIGSRAVLKARLYYDQFSNKLNSYDDNSYTTQVKKSSFSSFYNDNTFGGNAELSTRLSSNNNLNLSVHLKNDNHREYAGNDPVSRFADNTFSAGADDIHKTGRLDIISGLSYSSRSSLKTQTYNTDSKKFVSFPGNTSNSLNAQTAIQLKLSANDNLGFSIAWKSRFATMKDRYSYRLGMGIPNPYLNPENALNIEFSSLVTSLKRFQFRPEIFLSRRFNTIQLIDNVQEGISQMQNTGNSVFYGTDITIRYDAFSFLNLCGTYSYIKMKNLSNPEIHFVNVPDNKLSLSADINLKHWLDIYLSSEYCTGSYSATDGSRFSPGYFLLNSNITWHITDAVDLESGVGNILDKNYSLEEGYPEPGRNFYISIVINNKQKKY
jgi:iron complex outermembrane receptor protein